MHAGAKMILNGYKIAYVAEAKVYHSHNYTIWQEFKRYFDMGVFHRSESWLIETFGKPEGEGIKFVRSGVKYLEMHGAWYLIPEFFMRVAMNYLGYKLGQNYDKLPPKIRRRISLHDKWWNRLNKQFYSYDR